MYSEVIASNFLYHTTKYINVPVNVPKVSGLPNFYSLPNVKISTDKHFLTAFSQTAALSSSNYNSDTMYQLKKLRTKIPPVLFSPNHQATPVLHYNYLCKPNSLTLITQQELKLPNVICTGCETKSLDCLDCKYLKSETSPIDQMNLSTLRNSIKVLKDPANPQKQIIEIENLQRNVPHLKFSLVFRVKV